VSPDNTESQVRELVAGATRRDVSGLGLDDDIVCKLGIDSLAGLRVLAGLEKKFDLRIPDERLSGIRTMRQLLEIIDDLGGRNRP
jgi:acyl carrier protein